MMRIIKILKHLLIVTGALFIVVGVPLMMTDYWRGLLSSDEADAVSSPSVVIDKPSGNYIVLINTRLHTDKEKLNQWIDFFDGKETDIIFEDIACTVAEGDTMGLEMAESFRSKLPENQMKIKKEEAVLVVSRAEEYYYQPYFNNTVFDSCCGRLISAYEDNTWRQCHYENSLLYFNGVFDSPYSDRNQAYHRFARCR